MTHYLDDRPPQAHQRLVWQICRRHLRVKSRQKQRLALGDIADSTDNGLIEKQLTQRLWLLRNGACNVLLSAILTHYIRPERIHEGPHLRGIEYSQHLSHVVVDRVSSRLESYPDFRRQQHKSVGGYSPPSSHEQVVVKKPIRTEIEEDLLALAEDSLASRSDYRCCKITQGRAGRCAP
jgi:hypothetical protein